MKTRLIDLLASTVDHKTVEEIVDIQSKQESLKKPEELIELQAVYEECEAYQKTEKDKTDDLIELETGLDLDSLRDIIGYKDDENCDWYLVFDTNTKYSYLAKDLVCLNKNFVYRGDVELITCKSISEVVERYMETSGIYTLGCMPRFGCYILDSPSIEKYEVYYDSNYPKMQYGLATPKGCAIHKYKDRFHRDMAILELDILYSQASKIRAREFTKMELKPNEAIIVSDGAYLKNACLCAIFYIAADQIMKLSVGFLASDETQSSKELSCILSNINYRVNTKKDIAGYYIYSDTETYSEFIGSFKGSGLRLFILQNLHSVLLHRYNTQKSVQDLIHNYIIKLKVPEEPTEEFLRNILELKKEVSSLLKDGTSKTARWLNSLYSFLIEESTK